MTTERLRKLLNEGPSALPLQDLLGASQFEKAEFVKVAKEIASRSCEALRLYEPLPFQERFHACTAKECIIVKGNRAGGSLAGFAEDGPAGDRFGVGRLASFHIDANYFPSPILAELTEQTLLGIEGMPIDLRGIGHPEIPDGSQ